MALKKILIISITALLAACSNYENHKLIVDKNAESYNAVKLSVALVGDAEINCRGQIKYNDVLLHEFNITSHDQKKPEEFLINYSEFPGVSLQLASDLILGSKPKLEITVTNDDKSFSRKEYLELSPIIPPFMTGISLQNRDVAAKYPLSYRDEVYKTESFSENKGLDLDEYTIKKIASLSTLIKSNKKILSAVVPPGIDVPVYKGMNDLKVSVECDTFSLKPQLVLYPSPRNKYYEGPNLYQIAKDVYDGNHSLSTRKIVDDKFLIGRNFDVSKLTGEYDLFLLICNQSDIYFYYDIGSVIFDNVAPEFEEYSAGAYYFAGNASYEGKVYLDYKIPTKRNPYDVIFSGKVFGDVKAISVEGKTVDFHKNGDLLFSRKIYINGGYKDVQVSLRDDLGNTKDYKFPIVVAQ